MARHVSHPEAAITSGQVRFLESLVGTMNMVVTVEIDGEDEKVVLQNRGEASEWIEANKPKVHLASWGSK